jgi:hypothetical protein
MKRLLFPIAFGFFLLSVFGFVSMTFQQHTSPTVESTESILPSATIPATDESDTPVADEKLLVQTLERACTIEEEAQWTFNTEEYSTVFINDARYTLPPNILSYVRDIKNEPSISEIGFLDFKIAQIFWQQECTQKWKTISGVMQAENRDQMTNDEKASLFTSGGRMCPAPTAPELKGNVPCTYAIQSVSIEKDTAMVVASRGATTDAWYFVKKDGQWYITGREVLLRHP